jgi:hypothetical protein
LAIQIDHDPMPQIRNSDCLDLEHIAGCQKVLATRSDWGEKEGHYDD